MVVVADPSGAFVATWLVCGAECCAGKAFQIEDDRPRPRAESGARYSLDLPLRPGSGAAALGQHEASRPRSQGQYHQCGDRSHIRADSFVRDGGNRPLPYAGLVQGTDGALYGTAHQGGSSGYGTVFKLNTDGTGFTVLKNFDYSTTGGYLYCRADAGDGRRALRHGLSAAAAAATARCSS